LLIDTRKPRSTGKPRGTRKPRSTREKRPVTGDNNNITVIIIIILKSCEHVPKRVETSHKSKVAILWNQQCEPTELLLTTNCTS